MQAQHCIVSCHSTDMRVSPLNLLQMQALLFACVTRVRSGFKIKTLIAYSAFYDPFYDSLLLFVFGYYSECALRIN